jgi:hypothetical protein
MSKLKYKVGDRVKCCNGKIGVISRVVAGCGDPYFITFGKRKTGYDTWFNWREITLISSCDNVNYEIY